MWCVVLRYVRQHLWARDRIFPGFSSLRSLPRSHGEGEGGGRGPGDEEGQAQGDEGAEGHEVSWVRLIPLVRSGPLVVAPAPVRGCLRALVERGRAWGDAQGRRARTPARWSSVRPCLNVKSEYVRKLIVYASIWYVRMWCDVITDPSAQDCILPAFSPLRSLP